MPRHPNWFVCPIPIPIPIPITHQFVCSVDPGSFELPDTEAELFNHLLEVNDTQLRICVSGSWGFAGLA